MWILFSPTAIVEVSEEDTFGTTQVMGRSTPGLQTVFFEGSRRLLLADPENHTSPKIGQNSVFS